MKKVLVVCGPTSTGKTSLAIYLAKKFDGELVSADSRQVYKMMDIGTGKEWGDGIKIWGYDLIDPKKEFSVARYLKFANNIIEDIQRRGRLPILVGGTGLYIKGVIDGIPTVDVPRNKKLRGRLSEKTPENLYEMLSQIDAIRAGSLNSSDKRNPRRLIRAVEVATWMIDNSKKLSKGNESHRDRSVLFLGLYASKDFLDKKIEERVDGRVKRGVKMEIEKLLEIGVNWNDQSMSSLGYRQWKDYFEGTKSKKVVINDWKKEEKKYARRQITWFKKEKRINWFDITQPEFQGNVEKLVKKWYKEESGKEN
ncbi:MAG: tRNA (adenosine(37)-N6)-dimethylallyltransferase MiaA [bacterium]|nr:tRNA (adenosine(37)-N6)-dimethylallyltransferase MiaA [bacterium]